jgi:cell fate regulator YaaT (PSP1 superfamily)
MALRVLGIGPGDEVITTAYTYTATASVICHVGATPVLVDTREDSYEMDYDRMESLITSRTKAIIPVDLAGIPCDYDRIFAAVEEKKGLFAPANEIQSAMAAAERVFHLLDEPSEPADAPDAAEVEKILESDIFARREETIPEYLPEDKVVVAGIRFRTGGKTYFFDPGSLTCVAGKYAIVETARGQEFGEICIGNRMVDVSMVVPPLRPVIRIATDADIAHNKENRDREESAFRIGVEKIREHKLDMKLVSVQYTFDNAKLLFYFTSAGRVDFRELVKDLAGVFHIRIELRQIGIRDEARMIGGLGACGRPLCCTTFLSDFGQVSMKMAKEQNLSLNSTKISGCCGRLMCCLRYEYDTYAEEIKKTPAQGTFVNTPDGPGMVTEIFPLQGEVKVSLRNQN